MKTVRLTNYCLHIATIHKECIAKSEELLAKKMLVARDGIYSHLSKLDIIPQSIKLLEDNNTFELPNGHLGKKFYFTLGYYNLLRVDNEKRDEIHRKICGYNNSETHIKCGKASLIKTHEYLTCDSKQVDVPQTKKIQASTLEELEQNLKQSIWNSITEAQTGTSWVTNVSISNVRCIETSDGYEAEYTYTVSLGTLTKKESSKEPEI